MRRLVTAGACSVAMAMLAAAGSARAHDPFQVTSTARVHADRIDLKVTMFERTALQLCLDGPRTTHIAPAQFEASRAQFDVCAAGLYEVTAHGHRLLPSAARAALTDEKDVEFTLGYPPANGGPIVFDAVHLKRLPDPTYGAELTVTGDATFLGQALLRADDSSLRIDALPEAPAPQPSFGAYLWFGIEHILTGYDHLLFLAGLLVACRMGPDAFGARRGLRSMLAVVSAFTVAHSITLALAASGVFSLPPRVVEPLIAATVVFVGVENLLREEPKGRWLVAFAFGLIHGLGFAGALRQIGLGAHGAPFVVPLLSFNLGVEIGQIGLAALFLPLLFGLRKVPAFARHGTRAISLVVGTAGLYWLLERTVLS
jgi:hypothetical protein